MKVWIVRDLEPLPVGNNRSRLFRAGMLATTLARMGHDVLWFTSSFDHYRRRHRVPGRIKLGSFEAEILEAPGYVRNISFRRIYHNWFFARAFKEYASAAVDRPDVIVADIPTTEAAAAAVNFGLDENIPTVVSIRDLWPDFFVDVVPRIFRPAARMALSPLDRQARFACTNATSVVGISKGYLEWGLAKAGRKVLRLDQVIPLGYLPYPLPTERVQMTLLERLGIRRDARLVTFIGSWGHTYDLDRVLQAARALLCRKDVQFLIAGTGEQWDVLAPKFRALPNVLLPGWIDASEIAVVLNRTQIGLLPYKSYAPQGLPNKAFEYMAYGAYQISTIAGELAEFYEQSGGGICLSVSGAQSLTQAIISVLDNPSIAQNRENRVSMFEHEWHADKVYTSFVEHLATVANTGR